MSGGGAARSEWNQALLERVVAPAYARLVAIAAATLGPGPRFYDLLPRATPPPPWRVVVSTLCVALADEKVIHTRALGGKWITPREATYPDAELETNVDLRLALVDEGVLVADAPAAILDRFEEHAIADPTRASPNGARRMLREKGPTTRPRARVLTLLRYVLSDVVDDVREDVPQERQDPRARSRRRALFA